MTKQANFSGPISLPQLINSNDLLPNTSRSLPSCRRGDEDKTAEPAERGCAWGGPVITVNWFNMGMDGEKDEGRAGWKEEWSSRSEPRRRLV